MEIKLCGKGFLTIKHTEIREYVDSCPTDTLSGVGKYYVFRGMVEFHDYAAHVVDGVLHGGIY